MIILIKYVCWYIILTYLIDRALRIKNEIIKYSSLIFSALLLINILFGIVMHMFNSACVIINAKYEWQIDTINYQLVQSYSNFMLPPLIISSLLLIVLAKWFDRHINSAITPPLMFALIVIMQIMILFPIKCISIIIVTTIYHVALIIYNNIHLINCYLTSDC